MTYYTFNALTPAGRQAAKQHLVEFVDRDYALDTDEDFIRCSRDEGIRFCEHGSMTHSDRTFIWDYECADCDAEAN